MKARRLTVTVTILAILAISAVASRTLAFNEPDGFRGVPWGATEDQLREKISVGSCSDYPRDKHWIAERSCSGGFRLADLYVEPIYSFRGARFVRVTFAFPSSDFDRIAAIFIERYDSPTSDTTRPFKTQGGLESTNRILLWLGPVTSITLERFGTRITEGFASIATRAELEESARLRREQTKGAAKDL